MFLLLIAIGLLLGSGLMALLLNRWSRLASGVAVVCAGVAAILGLIPTGQVLMSGRALSFSIPWTLPVSAFSLTVDPLSAFFLLLIFPLSAFAAIYGHSYLLSGNVKKNIGLSWLFFNTLVASMVLVVTAQNAVLFLLAWEGMALASFFLVVFEDEDANVRRAGMIYLVAAHLGTAFLLAFFLLLFPANSGMDFSARAALGPGLASLLFILALIGFGTKAGLVPFHVWLPEAHPAAPSHVSALMSAVMIKTGIYGLLRAITFLGTPPVWWGALFVGAGLCSGIYGIIFALAQSDIKRFLAYSSIENIGIIAMGIGLGLLGMSYGVPLLMVLGFASALLHVLNHAAFKGLLFLGSGAILHATKTREMDLLGGLWKRMPQTGAGFLVGAIAICGLPPLNGFISEFILYLASFHGLVMGGPGLLAFLSIILGLSLIGGLAAAGFVKIFGTVFLGEPRSEHSRYAHDGALGMRVAMIALAVICVGLGLLAPFYILKLLSLVLAQIIQAPASLVAQNLGEVKNILVYVVGVALVFAVIFFAVFILRRRLLRGQTIPMVGTWDCGYAAPDSRMQYTATSFSRPITVFFQSLLRSRVVQDLPQGLFPQKASWTAQTPDVFSRGLYRRAYDFIYQKLSEWRWIQHGRAHFYILYILIALLVLVVWKMR